MKVYVGNIHRTTPYDLDCYTASVDETQKQSKKLKLLALGNEKKNKFSFCLPKERVNGVVTNMDGWYEAFDVTDGTLYRKPAERIKIW